VVFRADAGPGVGLGHVRRCLALSAALTDWAECRLLVCGDPRAVPAGSAADVVGPAWVETLAIAGRVEATALVVDSYIVTAGDLAAARTRVPLLVIVDDTARYPIPADIVVNAALGPEPPATAGDTTYLLGPRYALLGPEYAMRSARPLTREVRRVLIALGGSTSAELMARVVAGVRRALPAVAIDAAIGPVGDGPDAVRAAIGDDDPIALHTAPATLRPMMEVADLAVTAGGVTLLELAAAGVPSVGVGVAANQEGNLQGFARAGATIVAGRASDVSLGEAIAEAVRALAPAERRRTQGAAARALVDGQGAARVAARMRAHLQTTVRVAP
jgi:spore coat polysaccharide biosynthesis predicted glycosyltransferase SpsG